VRAFANRSRLSWQRHGFITFPKIPPGLRESTLSRRQDQKKTPAAKRSKWPKYRPTKVGKIPTKKKGRPPTQARKRFSPIIGPLSIRNL